MSEGTLAFSASGEDAITRTIDTKQVAYDKRTDPSLEELFEVEESVRFIRDGEYKRVRLVALRSAREDA
jgi:hypothetical protein